MTEEKDLDLLLALRPRPQHDELEQAPQRPVEKRQNQTPRATHQYNRPYPGSRASRTRTTPKRHPGCRRSFRHAHAPTRTVAPRLSLSTFNDRHRAAQRISRWAAQVVSGLSNRIAMCPANCQFHLNGV